MICGDLFDGDWKDYRTGLFFIRQMQQLNDANIPVYAIKGNHDASSKITKSLKLPKNVFILSASKPETKILEEPGVAIHGQSYKYPAVTEDISLQYPKRVDGFFNIGLLHTCANGRAGHEPYAPCTLEGLKSKGYDYWALGHVHQREVLCELPYIVFPGNIQGRHIREAGWKGCGIVSVEDGEIESVEHKNLCVVRWCLCEVDGTDAIDVDDIVDRACKEIKRELDCNEGQTLAIRLSIHGSCDANHMLSSDPEKLINEIRAAAAQYSDSIWIEKVKIKTRGKIDLDAIIGGDDPFAKVFKYLRDLAGDEKGLHELLGGLRDLEAKLPPEAKGEGGAFNFDDPQVIKSCLENVEQVLASQLL